MATRPIKYISAYDRLINMPEIFSLNAMVRLTGMNRLTAKVAISRWMERGLVDSAGPRAGIYFNRVRDREGQRATAAKAVALKYPSATLCGASVLHAASWTTQIPQELHLAIEARRSYTKISGIVLHPRPISWFRRMQNNDAWAGQDGQEREEIATYGLRALRPAWALADLYADESGKSWQPDEDDLDIPDSEMQVVARAFEVLGVAPAWFDPQADAMEASQSHRDSSR